MKFTFLALTVATFASCPGTASAQSKRLAFDPVHFGDTFPEAAAGLKIIAKRGPTTASDVVKYFITNRQKFPPKLQAEYPKITGRPGTPEGTLSAATGTLASTSHLAEFSVYISPRSDAAYPTEVKLAWNVFRDIAISKFGPPITSTPFPAAETFTQRWQVADTDTWRFDGLDIRLRIRSTEFPNRPRNFTAMLVAIDPIIDAANKVKK